jgi:hypothetical protein
VLGAVEELSEQLRTRGFRRRDLNKIKGVFDRRVKEVLKSLTDTGYLDCDWWAGPQGYSYTVAREAEEVSLGISLHPPPGRKESPAKEHNPTGREASARYRPMPDGEREAATHREAGATGRRPFRPVETPNLQEERATGRTGGEDDMCIHDHPGGEGCYVCDPNHPHRLKEGAKA